MDQKEDSGKRGEGGKGWGHTRGGGGNKRKNITMCPRKKKKISGGDPSRNKYEEIGGEKPHRLPQNGFP